MKRALLLISIIMVLISMPVAFAADDIYEVEGNKVVNESSIPYGNVVIYEGDKYTKITESNLVYINESVSTFGAITDFLIKENPRMGTYTVRLANQSTLERPLYKTFYITLVDLEKVGRAVKLEKVSAADGGEGLQYEGEYAGTYSCAYKADSVSLKNCRSVLVKLKGAENESKIFAVSIEPYISGDGTMPVAIQFDGMSEEQMNSIDEVYVSNQIFISGGETKPGGTLDETVGVE